MVDLLMSSAGAAGVAAVSRLAGLAAEDNPEAPGIVMTLTGAGIALFLLLFFNWVVGHAVTAAHEGGHALLFQLFGSPVLSTKIRADRSGATVGLRRPAVEQFLTTAVGYMAPPLFGLLAADLLGHGHTRAVLVVTVILLGLQLTTMRNIFGVVVVFLTGFFFVAVLARADADMVLLTACAWTWLLLAGGLLKVIERGAGAVDFSEMAPRWVAPGVWASLYLVLIVVVMILAGLILVGAREPFV